MRKHHELSAWQEAMQLVETTYKLTSGFPDSEQYGLANQMRRAAVSVPSNIAEGAARGSGADFIRFLTIARGSLSELETQTLISQKLGFMADAPDLTNQINRLFALIGGLINNLKGRTKA